jgi:hypothetical protein
MCWGKLPRHPGRADAWPLCGPWPRPHLAASKLVELRSSVNLVAMPHQPLDRPVASLTNPGLRDVRCAHIAPPWAVLGSPRCGCRGESQRAGDTNPGLRDVRCAHIAPPWAVLGSPRCGCRGESQRAGDTNPGLRDVRCAHIAPPWAVLGSPLLRRGQMGKSSEAAATGTLARLDRHWLRSQGSLSQWHEEASARGSSPSRLCVSGRSLSHANDQESHPLPDPAAARRCGGRRPVIRC